MQWSNQKAFGDRQKAVIVSIIIDAKQLKYAYYQSEHSTLTPNNTIYTFKMFSMVGYIE